MLKLIWAAGVLSLVFLPSQAKAECDFVDNFKLKLFIQNYPEHEFNDDLRKNYCDYATQQEKEQYLNLAYRAADIARKMTILQHLQSLERNKKALGNDFDTHEYNRQQSEKWWQEQYEKSREHWETIRPR